MVVPARSRRTVPARNAPQAKHISKACCLRGSVGDNRLRCELPPKDAMLTTHDECDFGADTSSKCIGNSEQMYVHTMQAAPALINSIGFTRTLLGSTCRKHFPPLNVTTEGFSLFNMLQATEQPRASLYSFPGYNDYRPAGARFDCLKNAIAVENQYRYLMPQ